MTVKLVEAGKKVSAANQAKIRASIEGLMALLDIGASETETDSTVTAKEAKLKIGPVQTLADVKKSLQKLIDYIPNEITREQLEGDGDGDGEDKDKDGNEGAQIQGAIGQVIEAGVVCADCGSPVSRWDQYCAGCGGGLTNSASSMAHCVGCGHTLPDSSGFCPECGMQVDASVAAKKKTVKSKEAATAADETEHSSDQVVQAVDAALDAIADALDEGSIEQAKTLVIGAQVIANELLEMLGLSDADVEDEKADTDKKESARKLSEAMKVHADHASNFKAMAPDTQMSHLMKMHGMAKNDASLQVPSKRFSMHKADHTADTDSEGKSDKNDKNESQEKESGSFEFASDFIPLVEKAVGRDGTIQVKMIGPGWGSSGYYSANLLEKDGSRAFPSGTKMFWNHPTDDEERQRPERDLRDLAAVTVSDAKYLQEGPSGPGLYAVAKPISTYAAAIEELAPFIGTSILASGRGKKGEAEGKKGTIVESIVSGRSCDFVTIPGAKGEIVQLFESVRQRYADKNADRPKEVEYDVDELREAQKRLREVESDRDRLQVRILLRDAHDMATDELSKVENLPAPTIRKLAESLSKDPPADEDGELDRKAFRSQIKESVKKEAEYIESIVGSGRVRGLGRSNDDWDNDDNSSSDNIFAEAGPSKGFGEALGREFGRLGLSESVSREAAAGRR